MSELTVGALYRHYKGAFYKVIGVGEHTRSGEQLVVYAGATNGRIWCRPFSEFIGRVAGGGAPRFVRMKDEANVP